MDLPNIGDGKWEKIVAPHEMWRAWSVAAEAQASRIRTWDVTTAVHERRINRGVLVLLYITLAGRVLLLRVDLVGLVASNGDLEVFTSTVALPRGSALPADLQAAYGVVDERHVQSRDLVARQWSVVDGKRVAEHKRKLADNAVKRASEGFQCKECGATSTSQRRCESAAAFFVL